MNISDSIINVGVNDHVTDLFEGHYSIPHGIAYNSYLILDDKITVMDSVDGRFSDEWFKNIDKVLKGKTPDYLVVQHMEPDHSSSIEQFMARYPKAEIVSSSKAFRMMINFFGTDYRERNIVVEEGNVLPLGKHTLNFVAAPMVHWPEVIVTYESSEKILFSADGFGKFGALDVEEPWDDEARRYYIGIVGKYGAQVQSLLSKAASLDIAKICPLHGPVLSDNLTHYISLYQTWSSYEVETQGIVIAYTSVYGHTKSAVELLAQKLRETGCPRVVVNDLARTDMAKCIADAFRYGKLVLATTTYNADVFPYMKEFIHGLTERNFQNRTVALIENGSWAPQAAKVMTNMLSTCKNLFFTENSVKIMSAMNDENKAQIQALADELGKEFLARKAENANKTDLTALFRIGYGLYVVTSNDGTKDNGCIVNTVSQVASSPERLAVCINKANYTHDIVKETGKMNVNCLSVEAGFSTFKNFGFQSGRNVDKFAGMEDLQRSANGLYYLGKEINAFMSLKVQNYVDLGSHGMFICTISEARVVSDKETMTYSYYQSNVKPKPQASQKKGWVCKVCGYVYEGEKLPEDFICPLCKHPASDFEPLK